MFISAVLLSVAPAVSVVAPEAGVQNRREEVRGKYHALFEGGDREGLMKLWKENESLVLQTIDADLEGSLSLWEAKKEDPPVDEIKALHARALFGAQAATDVLGRPVFVDYATSFVGWSDEEKMDFRSGQKVYGRAMQELEAGNLEVALEAGKETVLRAAPLGDWWGTAMGFGAQGAAYQAQGEFGDALSAYSQARLLNSALGLQFAEYRSLQGMLKCLRTLEKWQRGLGVVREIVRYAGVFGDEDGLKDALGAKAEIEKALGMTEEAEKTRKELEGK